MTRVTAFSNPLLLGFDAVERTLERVAKTGDGYPPYNIERLSPKDGGERLRITLAVAGFAESDLEVTLEDNQLVIRGRQNDDGEREYLHRGIAARQFQRCYFLLRSIGLFRPTCTSLTPSCLATNLVSLRKPCCITCTSH